jgi:hypothetical protein
MQRLWTVLVLIVALAAGYVGCSKQIDAGKDASGVVERVPPSTNPAARFSVRQEEGKWWLVSPSGRKFFSMGVCVVTRGSSKEQFDPENPGYAAFQHYETPAKWAEATTARMRKWGFTTVGGWSDFAELLAVKEKGKEGLWITPVLHMGSTSGMPWWDMWDEKNIARAEEVARGQILAVRDDPRLLGYYSDNELGWWNVSLWKATLDQPASSGQRKRLMGMLREEYGSSWEKLSRDFESDVASSFEELQKRGVLYLRGGGRGILVMRKFLGVLAERYYSLTTEIIRKYDRRGLILGDRYPSFYYPEVVAAAARHVDVISTNLNAAWNDGSYPKFQLETLYELSGGKPILVGEIYMSAAENRSGNRNSTGNFPVVSTQAQRAKSARNTIERLARVPYVVGVDWFQWADEPTHGRFDGENYNFGLVDIHDREYEELVGMMSQLDAQRIKAAERPTSNFQHSTSKEQKSEVIRHGRSPRSQKSEIPRSLENPWESFEHFKALKNWDRERGFVAPTSGDAPLADLYLCWKAGALYLGVHGWEGMEAGYYRSGWVPKEDRALWSVRIDRKEVAKARIGGGREGMVNNAAVRVESIPVAATSAWMTAAMEVPVKELGRKELGAGDEIEVECELVSHGRGRRVEWRGRFKLVE